MTYLHTSSQFLMQYVCPPFHDFDIPTCRVGMLAVNDRIHKLITELLACTQQAWLHKADHAMICKKVHKHYWYSENLICCDLL